MVPTGFPYAQAGNRRLFSIRGVNRRDRKETERFSAFPYDELIQRNKTNLDIFWLKDDSLENSENLPHPKVLAMEIVENLESALEPFRAISESLEENK